MQMGQTVTFGGFPNASLSHPQNIFVFVFIWAWTSKPIIASNWGTANLGYLCFTPSATGEERMLDIVK